MNNIFIDTITADSDLLAHVIELADRNTATLGFLPRQAFYEHASKRLILAAIDSSGNLAGYLLYRIVRRQHRIAIVHLCVDAGYRGQGISKQLFDALVERSRGYRGIVLLCRRDFETANRLWERLRFRPRSEKSGRGAGDTTLTEWWYDFGGTTLFDYAAVDKQQVIIDANIFFAFQDSKTAVPETLALKADWLNDEIELKVTPELFNEVNRQTNDRLRKKNLKAANTYRVAYDPHSRIDETAKALETYLPTKKLPNDLSDINHLAWSICDPDVSFFVTRDTGVLKAADKIFADFGLLVLRPTELILQIDEYVRIDEYTDMRFSGTQLSRRRIQANDERYLGEHFQYDDEGEKQSDFASKIRPFLANVKEHDSYIIEDAEGVPLVFFVFDRSVKDELRLPVLRLNLRRVDKKLIRHLLLQFLVTSAFEGRDFTRVVEERLRIEVKKALQEDAS